MVELKMAIVALVTLLAVSLLYIAAQKINLNRYEADVKKWKTLVLSGYSLDNSGQYFSRNGEWSTRYMDKAVERAALEASLAKLKLEGTDESKALLELKGKGKARVYQAGQWSTD